MITSRSKTCRPTGIVQSAVSARKSSSRPEAEKKGRGGNAASFSYPRRWFVDYRSILQFCGTKSGRDVDKVKETGLKPVVLDSGAMTFEQARLTLDCRKLFKSSMEAANFVDKSILEKWYGPRSGGSFHDVYVVEIEGVFAAN